MGEIGESFDIFDIVLEFLCVEGYAETLEEAEWMMANELDDEDIEAILEAEGSYGQTPKARTAMGKLEVSRRTKPVGEYSQRGEKTRKVKAAEKHNRRMDSGPDVGNRGKKSTSPRWSGYLGAKGRGKMDQDSRDWSRERDVEYSAGENKPGSGSVTKNPKKLRKQKAMGEIAKEEFKLWVNSLVEEGYDLSDYTWDEMRDIYEEEQLNELSNRKMRAYIKKSSQSHQAINKKWDQGTATEKEKLKSIGHEFGQERAYRKMDKRAGR